MSAAPQQQHDTKKSGSTPPNGGQTTPAAAATKTKKAPVPKDVFVFYGPDGSGTLKHFTQMVDPVKKGPKGESVFISAKTQVEGFINAADAPPGPFTIIWGNARRTKQKL